MMLPAPFSVAYVCKLSHAAAICAPKTLMSKWERTGSRTTSSAYSPVKGASFTSDVESSAGARVGIVEVKGTIGGEGPAGADAEKIVKLLKKYEKDDDIKSIVLRVDSPGGSVAPSQEIHDAVKRIKARKKVVVSMGGMAASGGYYISAPADRIFAEPGTLTGSIGVIFLHFNVRGLLEWAKVEETTLKSGKYKDTLSPFRPIQETDRAGIQSISDDVYSQFVQAVAQGRGMPEARVREIAEGRIYTGKRAKELKLVDELGGFDDAIAAAWGLAGQSGEPKVQYRPRDRELSLRDLVRGAFQGAFQGATEGMGSAVPRQGGLMFLAPNLVR